MGKYSPEFKLEVVKYVLEANHGYTTTSKKFNVNRELLRKWVKHYDKLGPEGLILKNKKYSGDFKLYVVEYMHNNHLSIVETSFEFSIPSYTTVAKWERIYYEEGPQALYGERRGRKKDMSNSKKPKKLDKKVEEDLIAENQRLRMENAYLKKLNALVQERIKQENKKKQ